MNVLQITKSGELISVNNVTRYYKIQLTKKRKLFNQS